MHQNTFTIGAVVITVVFLAILLVVRPYVFRRTTPAARNGIVFGLLIAVAALSAAGALIILTSSDASVAHQRPYAIAALVVSALTLVGLIVGAFALRRGVIRLTDRQANTAMALALMLNLGVQLVHDFTR